MAAKKSNPAPLPSNPKPIKLPLRPPLAAPKSVKLPGKKPIKQ